MYGQDRELKFGIIVKGESNRLRAMDADGQTRVLFQSETKAAIGVFLSRTIGKRFSLDGSVLWSRAKYTANYAKDGAVFLDADIRNVEYNVNLNYTITKLGSRASIYVFGGGQFLQRIWGEERFENSILPYTYWPPTRIMAQCGLGTVIYTGVNSAIQPFAGIRCLLNQQLVYDASVNQFFFGIVLGKRKILKQSLKSKYLGCPTKF